MIEFWLGVTNINNAKDLKKSYGIKKRKKKKKKKKSLLLIKKSIKLLGLFQPK